jgi:hypothetical protein
MSTGGDLRGFTGLFAFAGGRDVAAAAVEGGVERVERGFAGCC